MTSMNSSLTLTITAPGMSPSFMRDAPDGIHVIAPPMYAERTGFEPHVDINIDIKLVVDVARISGIAAALWILERIRRSKIPLHPRINGKELPQTDDEAVKMIADAIDEKDQQKRSEQ